MIRTKPRLVAWQTATLPSRGLLWLLSLLCVSASSLLLRPAEVVGRPDVEVRSVVEARVVLAVEGREVAAGVALVVDEAREIGVVTGPFVVVGDGARAVDDDDNVVAPTEDVSLADFFVSVAVTAAARSSAATATKSTTRLVMLRLSRWVKLTNEENKRTHRALPNVNTENCGLLEPQTQE